MIIIFLSACTQNDDNTIVTAQTPPDDKNIPSLTSILHEMNEVSFKEDFICHNPYGKEKRPKVINELSPYMRIASSQNPNKLVANYPEVKQKLTEFGDKSLSNWKDYSMTVQAITTRS